jgi:hypothetical protein
MIIVRLLSPEHCWLVTTTNSTRELEPTLSWNQYRSKPPNLANKKRKLALSADVARAEGGRSVLTPLSTINCLFTRKHTIN